MLTARSVQERGEHCDVEYQAEEVPLDCVAEPEPLPDHGSNDEGADGGGDPEGALSEAIVATFGDVESFRAAFAKAGMTRFGSGWSWLCVNSDGQLHVESTGNQDNPLSHGHTPILGCDVWEHAYYLNYQNRRGDYLAAFWNVVDWDDVATRYAAAIG